MLPENTLSSEPISSAFLGGAALPVRDITDYETGGIAIQDTSEGLQYQIWRARILNDGTDIVLDADQVDEFTIISATEITEVSLSFDQNMNPVIAYVEGGTAKLYWYDTSVAEQVTTEWPGIITPRVTLDDKRQLQSAISDVIFAYLKDGHLYYRQQRDRFEAEYLLQADVDSDGLIKIGMNRQHRLQFLLKP
ncbi:hypothetical protein ACJJIK_10635 [Microbulbifer sp. ZKSA006]|uniref:hypothetical protein n=1 Tax=Microbulbifer sp. ZKSA006 TaxID=3243390 RepID=UPI004039A1E2